MKKKKETIADLIVRDTAHTIAHSLFKGGYDKRADRLVLRDDKNNRDHGGWAFEPAVDQIERVLRAKCKLPPS